jgi:hypothetical protein
MESRVILFVKSFSLLMEQHILHASTLVDTNENKIMIQIVVLEKGSLPSHEKPFRKNKLF